MKNIFGSGFLVMLLAAVALAGCATSQTEKKLAVKEDTQSNVNTQKDLDKEAVTLLDETPGLTSSQKERLTVLRKAVDKDVSELHDESMKLKAVLMEDVMAPKYDEKEVMLIKSKLKKVEEKRLNVVFNAVTNANDILGRVTAENSRVMRGFIYEGEPGVHEPGVFRP